MENCYKLIEEYYMFSNSKIRRKDYLSIRNYSDPLVLSDTFENKKTKIQIGTDYRGDLIVHVCNKISQKNNFFGSSNYLKVPKTSYWLPWLEHFPIVYSLLRQDKVARRWFLKEVRKLQFGDYVFS